MAGRASIVGAAETSVGKVRNHNEDSHFIDPELGIFLVCDGMGGHAAGEVASALAVSTIRAAWSSDATQAIADRWLASGTPDARKQLIAAIQTGVISAHDAILDEAQRDRTKGGMGTTLVGALVVGGDVVFAQCGDSRAYLVRDGIAMQLTEDHTLLARLLAAGVDVDVTGDGSRFKSMLTNALGIGQECKVATFVVPVADGDRFLLCSDGITEYLEEAEIGEVLCKMPSPARAAQKLVEIALERGGGDNATALVVRVLEAGETSRPAEMIQREEKAIFACPLWAKVSPQQRLRALRIALPRDHVAGERMPAHTLGDRVAWILVDGEVDQDGVVRGPGALLYPEALLTDRPLPEKDALAVTRGEVRALALRSDDFREVCEDDPELAEVLLEALATEIATRRPHRRTGRIVVQFDADARGNTDPQGRAAVPEDAAPIAPPPLPPLPPLPPPPAPAPPSAAETSDEPEISVVAEGDEDPGRAPTLPPPNRRIAQPDTAVPEPIAEEKPAVSRTRTPPNQKNPLIVRKEDQAATDAALDDAMAKITGEAPAAVAKVAPAAEPAPDEDDTEAVIVVEAAEPPPPVVAPAPTTPARPARPVLGDHSDAEISIEVLADHVDNVVELEAEPPEPDIVVAAQQQAEPKRAKTVPPK